MNKSSVGCGCLLIFIVGFASLAAIGHRNAKREKLDADAKALNDLTNKLVDVVQEVGASTKRASDNLDAHRVVMRKKLIAESVVAVKSVHPANAC